MRSVSSDRRVKKELFENHDALGKLLRVKGFSCQIIGELEQKGQSGMGMDKDDVVIIPLNTFQRRISGKCSHSSDYRGGGTRQ